MRTWLTEVPDAALAAARRAFPAAAPHALRSALRAATPAIAAAEQAKLDAIYEWLVADQAYPFDWHGEKPAWLDLRKLAETWNAKEPETPEIWLEGILAETGWAAVPPRKEMPA